MVWIPIWETRVHRACPCCNVARVLISPKTLLRDPAQSEPRSGLDQSSMHVAVATFLEQGTTSDEFALWAKRPALM